MDGESGTEREEPRVEEWHKLLAAFLSCILVLDGVAAVWRFAPDSLRDYGSGLFLLAPVSLGLFTSIILGWKRPSTLRNDLSAATYAMLFAMAALLIYALEGFIC